jgi:excisionase family DNA binding protein
VGFEPHPSSLMKENGWSTLMNIVTAKRVAEYLKLTESTIYTLAIHGDLPGFKIGKSWRFDMDEILKMIAKQKKSKKIG